MNDESEESKALEHLRLTEEYHRQQYALFIEGGVDALEGRLWDSLPPSFFQKAKAPK